MADGTSENHHQTQAKQPSSTILIQQGGPTGLRICSHFRNMGRGKHGQGQKRIKHTSNDNCVVRGFLYRPDVFSRVNTYETHWPAQCTDDTGKNLAEKIHGTVGAAIARNLQKIIGHMGKHAPVCRRTRGDQEEDTYDRRQHISEQTLVHVSVDQSSHTHLNGPDLSNHNDNQTRNQTYRKSPATVGCDVEHRC